MPQLSRFLEDDRTRFCRNFRAGRLVNAHPILYSDLDPQGLNMVSGTISNCLTVRASNILPGD